MMYSIKAWMEKKLGLDKTNDISLESLFTMWENMVGFNVTPLDPDTGVQVIKM